MENYYVRNNIKLLKIERRGKCSIQFFFSNGDQPAAYGKGCLRMLKEYNKLITKNTKQIAIW